MTVHFRWTDEDGEPFCVGTWGHVDKSTITPAMVRNWCTACDVKPPRRIVVQHLYVRHDGSDDFPWHWCGKDELGAQAITAWRPKP